MIRVLIVHENPLFRVGLRHVLECYEGIHIVGETIHLDQILEWTRTIQPDIILFDGALYSCQPEHTPFEIVAQLRSEGAGGIIVFAPSTHEEDLFRYLVTGAAAYELPTISGDDLIEKIHRVANGEYLITSDILRSAPSKPVQQQSSSPVCTDAKKRHDPLQVSDREITILKHLMKGLSNKQIAQTLCLSDQTVKNHITSISRKLHTHDRTSTVVTALRRQLISLSDIGLHELVLDTEVLARKARRFARPTPLELRSQTSRSYAYAVSE